MTSENSQAVATVLPSEPWRAGAIARLAAGETLEAGLEVDLDPELRYAGGLLAVTDRRLMALSPGQTEWQEWPYRPGLQLVHHDHAGVGSLELHDETARLGVWRYTIAHDPAALRLVDAFGRQLESHLTGRPVERPEEDVCPKCGAPLDGEEECPVCAREIHAPPSTRTLLRLGRFARPYRWQLFWGFALTLVSTAAAMVPPYLTMPLMDDVLIPYQNGQPIDIDVVVLLLAGLFGAALVAWGLGWARTWLLALVSERVAADLRTAAFDHLLHLSLDYFGAKRTGDLMARIGSETDRISVFLSLHALDFATDVLMIAMTAAILVSINGMVRYGGTSVAAVDASVSAKPSISCQR